MNKEIFLELLTRKRSSYYKNIYWTITLKSHSQSHQWTITLTQRSNQRSKSG